MENATKSLNKHLAKKTTAKPIFQWRQKKIATNKTLPILRFVIQLIFLFVGGLLLFVWVLPLVGESFRLISTGIMLFFIGGGLVLSATEYARFATLAYRVESGNIVSHQNGKMIEMTSGRIIISRGLFSRREQILSIEEFDRVTIDQSLLGRIFNYGTIRLEQTDALETSRDKPLRLVSKPGKVGALIQSMIDVQKQEVNPMAP